MNIMAWFFTTACLHLILVLSSASSYASKIEARLIQDILKGTDPSIHPVLAHDTVLNLSFNMKIWQGMNIDEKHQTITIQNYFQMTWINEFLRWDPKKYENVTKIALSPENVWTPDIVLLNSAISEGATIQKDTDHVDLDYTGYSYWYPKACSFIM